MLDSCWSKVFDIIKCRFKLFIKSDSALNLKITANFFKWTKKDNPMCKVKVIQIACIFLFKIAAISTNSKDGAIKAHYSSTSSIAFGCARVDVFCNHYSLVPICSVCSHRTYFLQTFSIPSTNVIPGMVFLSLYCMRFSSLCVCSSFLVHFLVHSSLVHC